jgi:hypothetical protein
VQVGCFLTPLVYHTTAKADRIAHRACGCGVCVALISHDAHAKVLSSAAQTPHPPAACAIRSDFTIVWFDVSVISCNDTNSRIGHAILRGPSVASSFGTLRDSRSGIEGCKGPASGCMYIYGQIDIAVNPVKAS